MGTIAMSVGAVVAAMSASQKIQDSHRRRDDRMRAALDHRRTNDIQRVFDELRWENGELKLYLATIIALLIHKGTFTREEFAQVTEIFDREDGAADGQFSGTILPDGSLDPKQHHYDESRLNDLADAVKQMGGK